jgi:site-specific recombinase XerD
MEQILQDFEKFLEDSGKSKNSIKTLLPHIRAFLASRNVSSPTMITAQMITDYFVEMQTVSSQAKLNQAIWALKIFFKWSNVYGLEFPKQKHTLGKTIRPLTEQEVEAIEYWIYMWTLEPIHVRRHVLRLMFYTGLRVKDIMKLSHVDFAFTDESGESESTLEITKEGLNRKVTVSRNFSAELQHYLRWWPEYTNAFNISVANMNYMCKFLNQNDILGDGTKIYPELFRISFACRFLEQGKSLEELQKLLGHKSIRSTKRYLKLITKKVNLNNSNQ